MRTSAVRGGCAVVLVTLVVVACGGAEPSVESSRAVPGDKTGGRSGPIKITVVDSQPQGKPSNLPLAEFARQVASGSGETMAVTVVTDKLGDKIPASTDAEVIDGVKNGAFEMAVVPARAWSDAGVTSFRALQAPFLIGSDEQAAAIVTDDAITSPMLSGLGGTGVTGLVLYPEGLRHLFGFGAPILTPADMAGAQIRMIRSRDTDAIIEALGGVPWVEADYDAFVSGISDGTIRGIESSFTLVQSVPVLPIATGNVVPYAKVDTLVVNDGFWASLDDAQRTIVQDAARATRTWAIEKLDKDADAAAKYCRTGGSVVLADPRSVDEFRAAASDIVAELANDAASAALMTKMRDAAKGLTPEPVEACEAPIAMTIKPDGGDLPDGIYRVEFTDEYLKGWGVTDVNFQHGIWEYRLDDGQWTIDQQSNDTEDHDAGIYQVKGRELYWRWDDDGMIQHLTWSVEPNGDLRIAPTTGSPADWAWGLALTRVGPPD